MILFKYLGSERCSEKHVPHSAVGSGDDPFIRNDSSATEVVQSTTVHQGHHPRVFIHFRLNSAHDTGGSVHKPTIGCGYGMESQLNGESTCEWDSTFTSVWNFNLSLKTWSHCHQMFALLLEIATCGCHTLIFVIATLLLDLLFSRIMGTKSCWN